MWVVKVFESDLPGIEEAIREVFPQAKVAALCGACGEGCVGGGVRKPRIWSESTGRAHLKKALEAFERAWAQRYPKIAARWRLKGSAEIQLGSYHAVGHTE